MEEIKFTEQELSELKQIQKNVNDILIKLGQLEMNKINLEISKKEVESEYLKLMTAQKLLGETLTNKYGSGIYNPETGIFTPTPNESVASEVQN